MKQNRLKPLKVMLQRTAPRLYAAAQKRFWHWRYDPIFKAVKEAHGARVAAGPFQGMAYITGSTGSLYLPKILGCYEFELHPALEELIGRNYESIIDVGCAEGYYAVGLAKRLPTACVYAFDIEPEARRMCEELAGLNGVAQRVSVRGFCDAAALNALNLEKTLLISDCEGFELELLQPDLSPGLRDCDLLVELHEFITPGLTATLLKRFEPTHNIRLIDTKPREASQMPTASCLSPEQFRYAVDEGRPCPMQWVLMTCKGR